MDAPGPRHAWLLMTTDGGSLYDDQLGIEYLYDSKVQNHKRLQVGDPIALWDGERLLGISVIEQIEKAPGTKTMHRCPKCGKTRPNPPSKAKPRFRCSNTRCKAEFDAPHLEQVDVTMYAARYDAAWTALDRLLDEREIRPFILKSGSFNSVREIQWPAFLQALANKNAHRALDRVIARVPDLSWPTATEPHIELVHGFEHSIVRVRRGQRKFREHILASQGSNCAFTGAAPPRVLEAGHLYSYAQLGEHFEHGGVDVTQGHPSALRRRSACGRSQQVPDRRRSRAGRISPVRRTSRPTTRDPTPNQAGGMARQPLARTPRAVLAESLLSHQRRGQENWALARVVDDLEQAAVGFRFGTRDRA